MRDATDLIRIMKKAALDVVDASKPTAIRFGKVIRINPLKIKIEQKITLTEQFLILTRNVTDYKVYMTVDHVTENKSGGSGHDPNARWSKVYCY